MPYPNPAPGPTVQVLPPRYDGVSDAEIRVYTTAYRLVNRQTYTALSWGPLTLPLVDRKGARLSNGLYYVFVTVKTGTGMAKLMVLR